MRAKRIWLFLISFWCVACGAKKKEDILDDGLQASPSPNSAVVVASPTTAPAPSVAVTSFANIWVASNSMRAIASYDAGGNFQSFIDLSSYLNAGSITSITFLSKNTLIVTADPGAAGEKIIRIDLNGNNAATVNANWFQDSTNFNNISMYKIVKWSNSKLVAVKGNAMLEGLSYNIANNTVSRIGAPWINTGLVSAATCNITVNQYVTPVSFNGVSKLIGLSSGVNARINFYGNIDSAPTCDASVNYAGGLITAGHVPTGAVQMADGKVYVRYQSTANPAIIRYDYDGANLTNPFNFYTDSGFLNTTVTDRELVALDGTNMLFSNWSANAIIRVNTTTGAAEFFIKDMFTASVNAIGIRPAQ